MPKLTVELTWREWESLEAVAQSEEISMEEVVRRALDGYLAHEQIQRMQPDDRTITATRDHLDGPGSITQARPTPPPANLSARERNPPQPTLRRPAQPLSSR
jgi:hypothetical protein